MLLSSKFINDEILSKQSIRENWKWVYDKTRKKQLTQKTIDLSDNKIFNYWYQNGIF